MLFCPLYSYWLSQCLDSIRLCIGVHGSRAMLALFFGSSNRLGSNCLPVFYFPSLLLNFTAVPGFVLHVCSGQAFCLLCGAGLSALLALLPLRLCAHSGLARGPWVLLFTIPLSEGVSALLQSEFLRLAACPCAVLLGMIFSFWTIRCIDTSCHFGSPSLTSVAVTRHCCVSFLASALRGLLSWCGASVPLLALLAEQC